MALSCIPSLRDTMTIAAYSSAAVIGSSADGVKHVTAGLYHGDDTGKTQRDRTPARIGPTRSPSHSCESRQINSGAAKNRATVSASGSTERPRKNAILAKTKKKPRSKCNHGLRVFSTIHPPSH